MEEDNCSDDRDDDSEHVGEFGVGGAFEVGAEEVPRHTGDTVVRGCARRAVQRTVMTPTCVDIEAERTRQAARLAEFGAVGEEGRWLAVGGCLVEEVAVGVAREASVCQWRTSGSRSRRTWCIW